MTQCLVCGGRDLRFCFIGKDRLHAIPGTFRVVQCAQCKLLMLDPQPSLAELKRYYPSTYYAYAQYNPGTWKERFAIFLYRLFFKPGGNVLLKFLLLPFKHLLRGTWIIPSGRILDVGCGNGAFLYKMREAGMEAHGVELSRDGCAAARKLGLDVRCGTLEQQRYPANHFDVITLNHVFEHVPDPLDTLKELKRILKPGGRIIIAVPNACSLAAWLFGRYWASLETPRHLSIPTPRAMRIAAQKAGLSIRNIRYISFPSQFQASLACLTHPTGRIPLDKTWASQSRLLYWLFFPLVYLVDFLRIGDVIEVTLQR